MKFSVSSYSYDKLLKNGASIFDIIRLASEEGFDGIEFTDIIPPSGVSREDYAEKIREECEKYSLEPVCYAVSADFLYGSDGEIEKEIDRIKSQVDTARVLGVKLLRHDAAAGYKNGDRGYKGFRDALPLIVKGCSEVTTYAEKFGIKTMIENHGVFCQESLRVEQIINNAASDNFGLLLDIGNFLCADEDPAVAVGRLAPYAFHVHAKDFHIKSGNAPFFADGFFKTRGGNYLRGAILGHGDAPVYQCLSTIIENGYDGFITIEFEGLEDPETGVKLGLSSLKKIISSITGKIYN